MSTRMTNTKEADKEMGKSGKNNKIRLPLKSESDADKINSTKQSLSLLAEIQRIEQQLDQRNAEHTIINSLQEALAAQMDMQGIYDAVGEKIREVFDAQGVAIAYYDRPTNFITTPYYLFKGEQIKEPGFELGKGLISHIIHSGKYLLINEKAEERYQELGAIFASSEGEDTAKSWLGVPLIASGKVTGTITLENYEREHAYSDTDVRFLQTIANSMSVALENARLFDETQRLLKETKQRNAELAIINNVQTAIADKMDMQGIYNAVGDKIFDIFDAFFVGISTFDHQTGQEYHNYDKENGEYYDFEPNPIDKLRHQIIESRQTIVINTEDEFEKIFGAAALDDSASTQSGVFVPMVMGDVAWGYVTLQDLRPHAYSDSDVKLLETLANVLSVALENARLFDDSKKRNAEMDALRQAGLSLTSSLDSSKVLNTIVQIVRDLYSTDNVHLYLYADDKLTFAAANYADREQKKPIGEPRPEGLTYTVARGGEMIVINDMQKHPMYADASTDRRGAILGIPLKVGQNVVGVMNASRTVSYNDDELRSFTLLADQAAIAIQNSHLLNELVKARKDAEAKARREAALFRLSAELAGTLNESEICQKVVNGLKDEDLGYQLVTVLLLDEKTGERVTRAVIGHSDLDAGYRIPQGEGLSERPLLDGKLHYTPDVSQEASYVDGLEGSEIDVPLRNGQELIGVLVVESRKKDAFSQEDFEVLMASANQAAIAIGKSRLYMETQRQLEEVAFLNRIISATTSTQDPISVLEIVCRELADKFDSPQAGAAIFNQEHTALTIVAEYLAEGRPSAIEHVIPIARNLATQYVLKYKVPLAVDNVQTDSRMATIRHLMEERQTVSMLIIPLLARDEIIGTIGLDFITSREFSENDIALAFNAAKSTAQALANAQLFEQTNATLAELQRLEESQRKDIDEVDRYLPQEVREYIENTYYAKVNERGKLDNAILDPDFLKDTLHHMTLFSDHGVVHVRDVARNILRVLETINGVLIPHRDRQTLDFMKGYGVMLAYNHDIGLVDFSAKGRAMHPEYAAKKVFDQDFDQIVETVWKENWGNVAWRLINLVEQDVYEGDPKLLLREMLSMSIGHSKSKVPIDILNDPTALRRLMLKRISTEIHHLYYQQQISAAETKYWEAKENGKDALALENQRLWDDIKTSYADFCKGGIPSDDEVIARFYTDFETQAYAWVDSDHPTLQRLTLDVVDTLRALRVADALRQRGSSLKTSGGYPIFIDQGTANAVIALQKGSGEVLMFEVDIAHSIGEANIASSELTLEGNLRISFYRGSFLNEDAVCRAAHSCAIIVEDIQKDTIVSFIRHTQPPTQRKSSDDIQILIEETDDSLVFAEMVLDELAQINSDLRKRCRIVPSLSNVSEDERQRYLTAKELDGSNTQQRQLIIDQIAHQGKKISQFNPEAAFTDVRLTELREGDVLLEIGSPPGFVYVPMGDGLVSLSMGGYQPQNAPPWTALGNTRVIRGAAQESRVTAEKDVRLIMIPRAIYLKYWHDTYKVGELGNALKDLYT